MNCYLYNYNIDYVYIFKAFFSPRQPNLSCITYLPSLCLFIVTYCDHKTKQKSCMYFVQDNQPLLLPEKYKGHRHHEI